MQLLFAPTIRDGGYSSGLVTRWRCAASGSVLALLGILIPATLQSQTDLRPYMVQAACLNSSEQVRPGAIPTDPDCTIRRPLAVGEPLPYRKHDWPSAQAAFTQPLGWSASDSLNGTLRGRPAIVQIIDFGGDSNRTFGHFDEGKGDGGNALLLARDGSVGAAMTEDGAGGVQWFASPDCAQSGSTLTAGWLIADPPLASTWQERVAMLGLSLRPGVCPPAFVPSLTRWRHVRTELPLRDAQSGAVRRTPWDLMVSEHYGRATIRTAEHLERFFFGRDLGLLRWERWEDRITSRAPQIAENATTLASLRTCPPLAFSDPPANNWVMTRCRTWSNMVRAESTEAMRPAPTWPAASR
jgi:hypothetical protein